MLGCQNWRCWAWSQSPQRAPFLKVVTGVHENVYTVWMVPSDWLTGNSGSLVLVWSGLVPVINQGCWFIERAQTMHFSFLKQQINHSNINMCHLVYCVCVCVCGGGVICSLPKFSVTKLFSWTLLQSSSVDVALVDRLYVQSFTPFPEDNRSSKSLFEVQNTKLIYTGLVHQSSTPSLTCTVIYLNYCLLIASRIWTTEPEVQGFLESGR